MELGHVNIFMCISVNWSEHKKEYDYSQILRLKRLRDFQLINEDQY